MQMHRVATDGDFGAHVDFAVDLRAIVTVGEAVDTIGDRGDACAHLAFGIVLQGTARGQHDVAAVLGAQALESLHPQPVGRHLGAQVGQAFPRHLAVQQDQFLHVGL